MFRLLLLLMLVLSYGMFSACGISQEAKTPQQPATSTGVQAVPDPPSRVNCKPFAGFPGPGSRDEWLRAHKVYEEATALNAKNQFSAAAQKFGEATSIYPYDDDYHTDYGEALLRSGDAAGAEKAYMNAIKICPDGWRAHALLADLYAQQKRYADARAEYTRALDDRYLPEKEKGGIESKIQSVGDSSTAGGPASSGKEKSGKGKDEYIWDRF